MPRGYGIPTQEAVPMLADALAYYDETDVWRWFERNKRMTGSYPHVWDHMIRDVRTFKKVPNEPFRLAYQQAIQPLVLGVPDKSVVEDQGAPAFYGVFRDELERIRALPGAPAAVGPSDLTGSRITDYLRSALGFHTSQKTEPNGHVSISLSWLLQYEVAEALCKALGLTPIAVGI